MLSFQMMLKETKWQPKNGCKDLCQAEKEEHGVNLDIYMR